ncbi:uncharacterized protein [Lepisosteus oculatus]|uniref:uncharacterized protein n=1 Tax=Lepisosteus oculatus TaxID=7918 RepID=UPI0037231D19
MDKLLKILSLTVLVSDSARLCPMNCKFCLTGLADCTHVSSLTTVLAGIPTSIDKILLRGGPLTHFPAEAFRNFSQLKVLSINNFPLSSLPEHSFALAEPNSLTELDLSSNLIRGCGVEGAAFAGLHNLTALTLSGNFLGSLRTPWFQPLANLEILKLDNNGITYLQPRIFENLLHLKKLNLSTNRMTYVSTDTFFGLRYLMELDLSSNQLMFVSGDSFRPLTQVKEIVLFRNNLTSLPSIPKSTTTLHLHTNPWLCSCVLVSTITALKVKVMDPTRVTCASPAEIERHPVLEVYHVVCNTNSSEDKYPHDCTAILDCCQYWVYGLMGGFILLLFVFLLVCLMHKHCRQDRLTGPVSGRKDWDTVDCERGFGDTDNRLSSGADRPHSPPHCTFQGNHALTSTRRGKEGRITQKIDQIRLCRTAPDLTCLPMASKLGQVKKNVERTDHFESDDAEYFRKEGVVHCEEHNIYVQNPSLHDIDNAQAQIGTQVTAGICSVEDRRWLKRALSKKSKSCHNLNFNMRDLSLEGEERMWTCDLDLNKAAKPTNESLAKVHEASYQFKMEDHSKTEDQGLQILEDFPSCLVSTKRFFFKADNAPHCGDVGWDTDELEGSLGPPNFQPCAAENVKDEGPDKKDERDEANEGSKWPGVEGHLYRKAHGKNCFKSPAVSDAKRKQGHTVLQRKKTKQEKKKVVFWTGELLTRERFWKYHQNCCDEYKPCPAARTILKQLLAAPPRVVTGKASIERPPGDSDLLRNNKMLSVNLLLRLQEREERKRNRKSALK